MKKWQYIALGLFAAAVTTIIILITLKAPKKPSGPLLANNNAGQNFSSENQFLHYYGKPNVKINSIRLDLVYFVPNDVTAVSQQNWKPASSKAASDLQKFYEYQFENLVSIKIQIYPEAVIGQKNTLYYNGSETDGGNPQGLLNIENELKKRLSSPKGDLYEEKYSEKLGEYKVLGVIYEGVGAAGSGEKRSFLIAREYLTRKQLSKIYGVTFFAHEFGHTLGAPDEVLHQQLENEFDTTVAFTENDVMGSGRYRPLYQTHLSAVIKKQMISSYAQN